MYTNQTPIERSVPSAQFGGAFFFSVALEAGLRPAKAWAKASFQTVSGKHFSVDGIYAFFLY